MTDEEKKEIVAEVIQTLKTNAVTVDQLNEVLAYTDDDYVELNKGRKMRVKKIEENIASGIDNKYGVTIQNLETKDDEIEAYSKKITTEYNVSTFHPTSGTDGTNRYDLAGAIAQVPAELRSSGLTVSFLNESGNTEKWEFGGGSWEVGGFSQVGAGKIKELKSNMDNDVYVKTYNKITEGIVEGEYYNSDGSINPSSSYIRQDYILKGEKELFVTALGGAGRLMFYTIGGDKISEINYYRNTLNNIVSNAFSKVLVPQNAYSYKFSTEFYKNDTEDGDYYSGVYTELDNNRTDYLFTSNDVDTDLELSDLQWEYGYYGQIMKKSNSVSSSQWRRTEYINNGYESVTVSIKVDTNNAYCALVANNGKIKEEWKQAGETITKELSFKDKLLISRKTTAEYSVKVKEGVKLITKEISDRVEKLEQQVGEGGGSSSSILRTRIIELPIKETILGQYLDANNALKSMGTYLINKYNVTNYVSKTLRVRQICGPGAFSFFYDSNGGILQKVNITKQDYPYYTEILVPEGSVEFATSVDRQNLIANPRVQILEENKSISLTQFASELEHDKYLFANLENQIWDALGDSLTQGNTAKSIRYFEFIANKYQNLCTLGYGASSTTICKKEDRTDSFVERLGQLDPQATIVTIFGLTNDYYYPNGPSPLGEDTDKPETPEECTTIKGAIYYIIKTLLTNNPKVMLLFILPHTMDVTTPNSLGLTMEQYRVAIKEVCKRYNIPTLDLSEEICMTPLITSSKDVYFSDGIHFNTEDGMRRVSTIIEHRLAEICER